MSSDTEMRPYTPQDAAAECGCSTATVKRLADELRLPVLRTVGGIRLFTPDQVAKLRTERERRAIEAARNGGLHV